MGIADDDIDRVRAAASLVDIASEVVALKRVGTRFVGLCPFHAEKSGSFSVNAELNLYYCFGCQAKGDTITFVRETQHLDFVGAVEWLAGRYGITLTYDNSRESETRGRRKALVEAMAQAVDWYHERLLKHPDGATARGYLRSRGYDGDVVRRYKLGWAPDDWDALAKALKLDKQVLVDTGLAFVNKRDRLQDSFRARVLFPIFDSRGDAVAIGGRILPGSSDPAKYKNSPSTAIYDKSETLYALNWAKNEVVQRGEVVVCEGYTDVIGMALAGVPTAVATCGTALTDRHFATLKNFARRIVLAYDADAAGQGAAERFYEWEQKHEVDVYVAALPAGKDPGDLARTDPEALQKAVTGAKRFLEFRLDRLLQRADLRSVEGRARAAGEAGAMIREHPNQIVREQYAGQVAVRLELPADAILRGGPVRIQRPTEAQQARRRQQESPALMVLRLAVHRPEEVADRVDEVLFTDPVHVSAFRALASSATLHDAIGSAEPEAAELLQRLAVEEVDVEADDVLALLVGDAARRALDELTHAGDFVAVAELHGWLKLRLDELMDTESRRAATAALVSFLVERAEEGK